jgi:hypothetical protein
VLALWEVDLALTTDTPKKPTEPMIHKGEVVEAFATHQQNFAFIKMSYNLELMK